MRLDTYFFEIRIYFTKNGDSMRVCDLKQKEIINTCNCRSLGCPTDVEFDCRTGALTALIVAGPGKICGFLGKENELVIPWKCICQIGEDIILVDFHEGKPHSAP